MLPSIKHLQRIYEKKQNKVSAKTPLKILPKLPKGFIYSGDKIIHRYFGKDLKHFGIFSGDVLTIEKESSFLSVKSDALYAVAMFDGKTRICAISYRGLETVLHDGRGNDFRTYRTALLTLIGEVLRGEKCK